MAQRGKRVSRTPASPQSACVASNAPTNTTSNTGPPTTSISTASITTATTNSSTPSIKRRKCRQLQGPPDTGAGSVIGGGGGGVGGGGSSSLESKVPAIYNRGSSDAAPAELFRKDLISAMKLPDSEPLAPHEYWLITDQWKQEWERGVQVPVNPDSLPEANVWGRAIGRNAIGEFKLPKKFVRISRDEHFNPDDHHLSTTPTRAEKACAYDLDDMDVAWLELLNGERAQMGQTPITEPQLERVIEELEMRCWERIQTIVKNEEGLGIEYDENVICDVCRSPDSEEGNEMVFCDCCNICVHQACYGITQIPDGSWLCRTCSLSQRPDCVLCPNKGGAMKCTRSGQKWAHVSCALWIPEVSIGCVEKMEPITKISSIPQSRWALICVLCRERVGACIQCSIKTCKTAYHVTCAFKYGLEMKAIIEDEMADDGVKLRSYCQKHSRNTKDKSNGPTKNGSDSEDETKRRKRKDMTSEEKNQARAAKLQEIEAEFDKHVALKDIGCQQLDVDQEVLVYIYNYWKLKRRASQNKPLLAPRHSDLSHPSGRSQCQQAAADLEKMRTFVQLRQDLERVRNLCYMVGRREKLCRSFLRLREQTFHKQVLLLSSTNSSFSHGTLTAILEANHGPSLYDRLYSNSNATRAEIDLEELLRRLTGDTSATGREELEFNGKVHVNGRRLYSDLSESDESVRTGTGKRNKERRREDASKRSKPDGRRASESEDNASNTTVAVGTARSNTSTSAGTIPVGSGRNNNSNVENLLGTGRINANISGSTIGNTPSNSIKCLTGRENSNIASNVNCTDDGNAGTTNSDNVNILDSIVKSRKKGKQRIAEISPDSSEEESGNINATRKPDVKRKARLDMSTDSEENVIGTGGASCTGKSRVKPEKCEVTSKRKSKADRMDLESTQMIHVKEEDCKVVTTGKLADAMLSAISKENLLSKRKKSELVKSESSSEDNGNPNSTSKRKIDKTKRESGSSTDNSNTNTKLRKIGSDSSTDDDDDKNKSNNYNSNLYTSTKKEKVKMTKLERMETDSEDSNANTSVKTKSTKAGGVKKVERMDTDSDNSNADGTSGDGNDVPISNSNNARKKGKGERDIGKPDKSTAKAERSVGKTERIVGKLERMDTDSEDSNSNDNTNTDNIKSEPYNSTTNNNSTGNASSNSATSTKKSRRKSKVKSILVGSSEESQSETNTNLNATAAPTQAENTISSGNTNKKSRKKSVKTKIEQYRSEDENSDANATANTTNTASTGTKKSRRKVIKSKAEVKTESSEEECNSDTNITNTNVNTAARKSRKKMVKSKQDSTEDSNTDVNANSNANNTSSGGKKGRKKPIKSKAEIETSEEEMESVGNVGSTQPTADKVSGTSTLSTVGKVGNPDTAASSSSYDSNSNSDSSEDEQMANQRPMSKSLKSDRRSRRVEKMDVDDSSDSEPNPSAASSPIKKDKKSSKKGHTCEEGERRARPKLRRRNPTPKSSNLTLKNTSSSKSAPTKTGNISTKSTNPPSKTSTIAGKSSITSQGSNITSKSGNSGIQGSNLNTQNVNVVCQGSNVTSQSNFSISQSPDVDTKNQNLSESLANPNSTFQASQSANVPAQSSSQSSSSLRATKNNSLESMERELGSLSNTDSDELITISSHAGKQQGGTRLSSAIYSDTDSEDFESQTLPALITKAAVKQFTAVGVKSWDANANSNAALKTWESNTNSNISTGNLKTREGNVNASTGVGSVKNWEGSNTTGNTNTSKIWESNTNVNMNLKDWEDKGSNTNITGVQTTKDSNVNTNLTKSWESNTNTGITQNWESTNTKPGSPRNCESSGSRDSSVTREPSSSNSNSSCKFKESKDSRDLSSKRPESSTNEKSSRKSEPKASRVDRKASRTDSKKVRPPVSKSTSGNNSEEDSSDESISNVSFEGNTSKKFSESASNKSFHGSKKSLESNSNKTFDSKLASDNTEKSPEAISKKSSLLSEDSKKISEGSIKKSSDVKKSLEDVNKRCSVLPIEVKKSPESSSKKLPETMKKSEETTSKGSFESSTKKSGGRAPRKKKELLSRDLIVPQRQAAKKASENMQRSQHKLTDETKEQRTGDEKRKKKRGGDVYDIDKELLSKEEILSYVPQRQAAKKAAETIKSGLGKDAGPKGSAGAATSTGNIRNNGNRGIINPSNLTIKVGPTNMTGTSNLVMNAMPNTNVNCSTDDNANSNIDSTNIKLQIDKSSPLLSPVGNTAKTDVISIEDSEEGAPVTDATKSAHFGKQRFAKSAPTVDKEGTKSRGDVSSSSSSSTSSSSCSSDSSSDSENNESSSDSDSSSSVRLRKETKVDKKESKFEDAKFERKDAKFDKKDGKFEKRDQKLERKDQKAERKEVRESKPDGKSTKVEDLDRKDDRSEQKHNFSESELVASSSDLHESRTNLEKEVRTTKSDAKETRSVKPDSKELKLTKQDAKDSRSGKLDSKESRSAKSDSKESRHSKENPKDLRTATKSSNIQESASSKQEIREKTSIPSERKQKTSGSQSESSSTSSTSSTSSSSSSDENSGSDENPHHPSQHPEPTSVKQNQPSEQSCADEFADIQDTPARSGAGRGRQRRPLATKPRPRRGADISKSANKPTVKPVKSTEDSDEASDAGMHERSRPNTTLEEELKQRRLEREPKKVKVIDKLLEKRENLDRLRSRRSNLQEVGSSFKENEANLDNSRSSLEKQRHNLEKDRHNLKESYKLENLEKDRQNLEKDRHKAKEAQEKRSNLNTDFQTSEKSGTNLKDACNLENSRQSLSKDQQDFTKGEDLDITRSNPETSRRSLSKDQPNLSKDQYDLSKERYNLREEKHQFERDHNLKQDQTDPKQLEYSEYNLKQDHFNPKQAEYGDYNIKLDHYNPKQSEYNEYNMKQAHYNLKPSEYSEYSAKQDQYGEKQAEYADYNAKHRDYNVKEVDYNLKQVGYSDFSGKPGHYNAKHAEYTDYNAKQDQCNVKPSEYSDYTSRQGDYAGKHGDFNPKQSEFSEYNPKSRDHKHLGRSLDQQERDASREKSKHLKDDKDDPSGRKRRVQNRSIFSPQHKESVTELFDFDQELLNDGMNEEEEEGFGIREEERNTSLTFTFGNEIWFKEDSKEDSARETLHLVEKLRMELSKKSNSMELPEGNTREQSSKQNDFEDNRGNSNTTSNTIASAAVLIANSALSSTTNIEMSGNTALGLSNSNTALLCGNTGLGNTGKASSNAGINSTSNAGVLSTSSNSSNSNVGASGSTNTKANMSGHTISLSSNGNIVTALPGVGNTNAPIGSAVCSVGNTTAPTPCTVGNTGLLNSSIMGMMSANIAIPGSISISSGNTSMPLSTSNIAIGTTGIPMSSSGTNVCNSGIPMAGSNIGVALLSSGDPNSDVISSNSNINNMNVLPGDVMSGNNNSNISSSALIPGNSNVCSIPNIGTNVTALHTNSNVSPLTLGNTGLCNVLNIRGAMNDMTLGSDNSHSNIPGIGNVGHCATSVGNVGHPTAPTDNLGHCASDGVGKATLNVGSISHSTAAMANIGSIDDTTPTSGTVPSVGNIGLCTPSTIGNMSHHASTSGGNVDSSVGTIDSVGNVVIGAGNVVPTVGTAASVNTDRLRAQEKLSQKDLAKEKYLDRLMYPENLESKVSIVERSKLDRAASDERWVPPSQFESLQDSSRYVYQEVEEAGRGYMVPAVRQHVDPNIVKHMDPNMAKHLDSNLAKHMDSLPKHLDPIGKHVDPIIGKHQDPSITKHIEPSQDEVTPLEMVNRHLSLDDHTEDLQDYRESSPYELSNLKPDGRWNESQVLPSRRSTSSSITSASSEETVTPYKGNLALANVNVGVGNIPYQNLDSYYGENYSGPVSLFPSQNLNFAPIFPPPFGAPFPTPNLVHSSLLSKPLEEVGNTGIGMTPCTATFTSTSHNMALTTSIISPKRDQEEKLEPEEKLENSLESLELEKSRGFSEEPAESLEKSSQPTKKSPARPIRVSLRVTNQRSPGKSPRSESTNRTASTHRARGRGKSVRGRGRGRGRGRARNHASTEESFNKFVGTVYDFDSDEDSITDGQITDLRTMRERKKSSEIERSLDERPQATGHQKKSPAEFQSNSCRGLTAGPGKSNSSKNQGQSKHPGNLLNPPKNTITLNLAKTNASLSNLAKTAGTSSNLSKTSASINLAKSSTNLANSSKTGSSLSNLSRNSGSSSALPKTGGNSSKNPASLDLDNTSLAPSYVGNTVLPVLPGPVDMRTYSSVLEPASGGERSYSLANFAGPGEQNLPDIEEDIEKELSLKGSLPEKAAAEEVGEKVSLSDSRNQLKVKIKGPFLDANYVGNSVPPLAQQAPVIIAPNVSSASGATGTSNLRRMRKKELLRQYCSQDMNMDPNAALPTTTPTLLPINRTVITIPKAVASMTSIPTREDYKAVVDANTEKKRQSNSSERRRGRPRPSPATNAPPKLKIKIGNSNLNEQVLPAEDTKIRPPKKRLSSIPMTTPTMEELRRESMKFRRMIMAGFESDDKAKVKGKKGKNSKRKRRQEKKEARVRILEDGAATPKLIITLKASDGSSNGNRKSTDGAVDGNINTTYSVNTTAGSTYNDNRGNFEDRVGLPTTYEKLATNNDENRSNLSNSSNVTSNFANTPNLTPIYEEGKASFCNASNYEDKTSNFPNNTKLASNLGNSSNLTSNYSESRSLTSNFDENRPSFASSANLTSNFGSSSAPNPNYEDGRTNPSDKSLNYTSEACAAGNQGSSLEIRRVCPGTGSSNISNDYSKSNSYSLDTGNNGGKVGNAACVANDFYVGNASSTGSGNPYAGNVGCLDISKNSETTDANIYVGNVGRVNTSNASNSESYAGNVDSIGNSNLDSIGNGNSNVGSIGNIGNSNVASLGSVDNGNKIVANIGNVGNSNSNVSSVTDAEGAGTTRANSNSNNRCTRTGTDDTDTNPSTENNSKVCSTAEGSGGDHNNPTSNISNTRTSNTNPEDYTETEATSGSSNINRANTITPRSINPLSHLESDDSAIRTTINCTRITRPTVRTNSNSTEDPESADEASERQSTLKISRSGTTNRTSNKKNETEPEKHANISRNCTITRNIENEAEAIRNSAGARNRVGTGARGGNSNTRTSTRYTSAEVELQAPIGESGVGTAGPTSTRRGREGGRQESSDAERKSEQSVRKGSRHELSAEFADKKQADVSAKKSVRSAKLTPIRLKLTRCQVGEGYELERRVVEREKEEEEVR